MFSEEGTYLIGLFDVYEVYNIAYYYCKHSAYKESLTPKDGSVSDGVLVDFYGDSYDDIGG